MPALREHPAWQLSGHFLRYAIAGGTVAATYVGLTLLLSGPADLPIQLAILVAYVLAVALHFLLQRVFVFRAQSTFVLSTREQLGRYCVIGAVQYAVSVSTTTLLPSVLGVSEQIVYVGTVVALSAAGFLLLKTHVFHRTDSD